MSKTTLLVSFFFIFFHFLGFSQEVTMSQTIEYLNKKLRGQCKIEVKKRAIVEFYKDGQAIREDKFNLEALDPSLVEYVKDDNFIKLSCIGEDEECFARWIYKNDIKRYYSRLTFSTEGLDEKSIEGLVKAFQHLIKLSLEPDYKLYEFFE